MESIDLNKSVVMPTIIVRGVVLLPNNEVKIEVGREFSKNALVESENFHGNHIFVVSQHDPLIEDPVISELFRHGVIGRIKMKMRLPNGNNKIIIKGLHRAEVLEYINEKDFYEAKIKPVSVFEETSNEEVALVRKVVSSLEQYVNILHFANADLLAEVTGNMTADKISDIIAYHMPLSIARKQAYVEEPYALDRLKMLIEDIEKEKEIAKIEAAIEHDLREHMDKTQREYYLREKLRVIKEELGETSSKEQDADDLRARIEGLDLPANIYDKAMAELLRYDTMPSNSQEGSIVRNYIDWLISLPWNEETKDNDDLNKAQAVLDETHYGLEKVKDRIIEYLAVKQMTGSLNGPIICFVGPPGVGKTSLVTSIAKALNRNFVKMSLGGVRDEAEIRGHRRTYLGAMPGRIIQGMRKAGSTNPVFLLDEIDKMTSDFKGDPSSALLEVLDPEQNKFFSDHFVEEEYDLSNVMFIATANYLERIPAALRDRLEIIHLSGYTELEKLHIAKEHLIAKELKNHGLKKNQMKLSDRVLFEIIRKYTREAGVRNLQREIAKIARKTVRNILITGENKMNISLKNLHDFLGKERYTFGLKEKRDQVGVATGLAYTAFGGDILPIEVTFFKGKGKIVLTGSLGDVMKESAHIALSYLKTHAKDFDIDYQVLEENDIHIHVPEGAVPKDGPSAGITLTTALISAFTNRPIRKDVGMTGEITLRGHVLPIGGLKEKSLGAHRSGIKTIIIPKENEKDLEDIPEEIKEQLEYIPVSDFKKVFEIAVK